MSRQRKRPQRVDTLTVGLCHDSRPAGGIDDEAACMRFPRAAVERVTFFDRPHSTDRRFDDGNAALVRRGAQESVERSAPDEKRRLLMLTRSGAAAGHGTPIDEVLRWTRLDDFVGQGELEALEHDADTRRQALADMLAPAFAFFEERHVEPELLEPHGTARARWPSSDDGDVQHQSSVSLSTSSSTILGSPPGRSRPSA